MIDYKRLIEQAFEARERSYSPYSGFMVGAALLTREGDVIKGANIESASLTPTCCAERTAFFKALTENIRDFRAIAIVGGPKDTLPEQFNFCAPCGVCRQVMAEFCDLNEFEIILAKSVEEYKIYSLDELLPLSFTGKDLGK